MKKVFLLSLLAVSLWLPACENKQSGNQAESATPDASTPGVAPVMTFKEQEVNLGKMTEGDTLRHQFQFTNTGNAPLLIQSAVASCGCTVPSYPKEAVAPGKEGVIDVVFNSKNKAGFNTKTVTVYANTKPDMNTVSFKVEVLPKAEAKVQ
ncbi:MAG: DUF1573 domain-containing protein [Cytophagaceae bacterium]|nr:DUF1573 domain-containing protein [Cytophagaceae bacterium]